MPAEPQTPAYPGDDAYPSSTSWPGGGEWWRNTPAVTAIYGAGGALGIQHLEPILDAVIETLRAVLPGLVAAVNEASQDFDLDPVDPTSTIIPAGAVIPTSGLSIEVAVPDGGMATPSIDPPLQFDALDQVVVRIAYQVPEAEQLYRALLRYAACVIQALLQRSPDDQTGFGPGAVCDEVRYAYRNHDPEAPDYVKYSGSALVFFRIERVEAPVT